jgi:hypothetical protein
MDDLDGDIEVPPAMPPMPTVFDQKNISQTQSQGCPPCPMPMMMPYPYKERSRRKRNSGNSTFFIMLLSAAFFAVGVWFSIRLPSYAPGGSREDSKTFTFVQILSTALVSAGVLLLVIAWFTGK